MRDLPELKVPKWPFFLADAFALGLAYFVFTQGKRPLTPGEIVAICICVGAGALLGIAPFLLEYRALLKAIEVSALGTATEKIQKLETVAAQISGATNHWQAAQEQADKTVANAREISERMAKEAQDFSTFMQKINEGEKSTLRLEIEKLRRAESDWLNVTVHMLDHVYALHQAATRSGQPKVIAQVGNLQNACRDIARRIGLIPLLATPDEPFDAKRHQWTEDGLPSAGSVVAEMLATGYTYQGRPIRSILVRVQSSRAPEILPDESAPSEKTAQEQLPLESETA